MGEDELLLSMLLEDLSQKLGCMVVSPASIVAQAPRWLPGKGRRMRRCRQGPFRLARCVVSHTSHTQRGVRSGRDFGPGIHTRTDVGPIPVTCSILRLHQATYGNVAGANILIAWEAQIVGRGHALPFVAGHCPRSPHDFVVNGRQDESLSQIVLNLTQDRLPAHEPLTRGAHETLTEFWCFISSGALLLSAFLAAAAADMNPHPTPTLTELETGLFASRNDVLASSCARFADLPGCDIRVSRHGGHE